MKELELKKPITAHGETLSVSGVIHASYRHENRAEG